MFDIGFWELLFLFGLGLVILGPERLPRVAAQLGNWAGQARRMARSLTSQIRDELDIDLRRPFDPPYTKQRSGPKRPGNEPDKPAWQTSEGLRPGASSADSPDADKPTPTPASDSSDKTDPDVAP